MDALPLPVRQSLPNGSPFARLVAIWTPPQSHGTLLALLIAEELRRLAVLGVNYVNVASPWRKLSYRYPSLRGHFTPVDDGWLDRPRMRPVPRTRLDILLEWIVMGGKGVVVPTEREEPPASLLPDFERLWEFVERCRQIPALVIVDTIDALAGRYGVDVSELVEVLDKDLVEPGYAHALVVSEGDLRPDWFSLADAVLRFMPIRTALEVPHWLLEIEGLSSQPQRFVMAFDRGRLAASPSDDEIVEALERGRYVASRRRIPTQVLQVFQEPEDLLGTTF